MQSSHHTEALASSDGRIQDEEPGPNAEGLREQMFSHIAMTDRARAHLGNVYNYNRMPAKKGAHGMEPSGKTYVKIVKSAQKL